MIETNKIAKKNKVVSGFDLASVIVNKKAFVLFVDETKPDEIYSLLRNYDLSKKKLFKSIDNEYDIDVVVAISKSNFAVNFNIELPAVLFFKNNELNSAFAITELVKTLK
jgi:hypothetical protein